MKEADILKVADKICEAILNIIKEDMDIRGLKRNAERMDLFFNIVYFGVALTVINQYVNNVVEDSEENFKMFLDSMKGGLEHSIIAVYKIFKEDNKINEKNKILN